MKTITNIKDELLEAISAEIKLPEAIKLESLVMAYASLCQTETMCKCPTRDDEGQEFPGEIS